MPYRIAGIDVHKKTLAVVVTDVDVEDDFQFERRWYGSNPEQLRQLGEWLIEQQVDSPILEACLGRSGAVLEAGVPEPGRCRTEGRNPASGASPVQSRPARAQERLSRC